MLTVSYTIPFDLPAPVTNASSTIVGQQAVCIPTLRHRQAHFVFSASEDIEEAVEGLQAHPPEWAKLLQGRLHELEVLEPGWDGDGSSPVSRFALYTAGRITRRALVGLDNATSPYIVPGGDGSVQIEWHEKHGELELAISPHGTFTLWGNDYLTRTEIHGEGESALTLFNRWAPRLATEPHNATYAQTPGTVSIFASAA